MKPDDLLRRCGFKSPQEVAVALLAHSRTQKKTVYRSMSIPLTLDFAELMGLDRTREVGIRKPQFFI